MKKILVATDFSAVATNAVAYAAQLARVFNANLVLLHVVPVAVMPPDGGPLIMEPTLLLIQEQEAALRKEIERLTQQFPLIIEGYVRQGSADTIPAMATELEAELVVMGASGGGASSRLLGGMVTSVIRRSRLPVLTVPAGFAYTPPTHMHLAADFAQVVTDTCYTIFHALAGKYQSFVRVVHVQKNDALDANEIAGKLQLEQVLEDIPHAFFTVTQGDVGEGLLQFQEAHAAGMLIMIAHRHHFFKRLFGEVHTRSMSFATQVPLLVLQDK